MDFDEDDEEEKLRRKRLKTYLVCVNDDWEFAISNEMLEALAIEILANQTCLPPEWDIIDGCSVLSLNKFLFGGRKSKYRKRRRPCSYLRQLKSIGHCLRRALLKHKWNDAVHLLQLICNSGIFLYRSTILCTCVLLLINHPNSSIELFEKYMRLCTKYDQIEDIRKFIKVIFVIREERLLQCKVGKYVRAGQMYKIVDEMFFKDL